MNDLLQQVTLLGDNIPWLKDVRATGKVIFEQNGIPNAKSEAWKYTKPNMFFSAPFVAQSQGIDISYQPELPFDCYKICFINGVFTPASSQLPQTIEVMPIIEAVMFKPEVREQIGKLTDINRHPFAALNAAYFNEGAYIHLNGDLDKPLVLIYHFAGATADEMYNIHNLIVLDGETGGELIEYYDNAADIKSRYFINTVNEIYVDENARLNHYKVQNDAFKAVHIALQSAEVKENGIYKSFCLNKGADLARNETQIKLIAANARAQVNAIYAINGWAVADTTTDIEHLFADTHSSQLVKGVAGGQTKGVFQGKIHIAPDCIKSEGYQQHRALLLSDEAEIDVKPELEIFADDVKCTHGSACGQIDAEQMFYLRSRGISEESAKQMLVDAYLEEVIAKVDNEKIADWIKLLLKMS